MFFCFRLSLSLFHRHCSIRNHVQFIGEAASISLAKEKQGILASNNLRDISAYVTEYGLSHLTTGDIMKMALDAGYINESQGNTIWANMLARKRKLGYASFSDYLAAHKSETK